jgi:hypothetical protein
MMRLPRFLMPFGLLALLAACDSVTGARMFTPESTVYDGAWVGTMNVAIREQSCRLTRGGLRVRIEGGRMDGIARFQVTQGDFTGVVGEDGAVRAELRGRYAKDDVQFTGTLGEQTGAGEWRNEVCGGEWELRKAR